MLDGGHRGRRLRARARTSRSRSTRPPASSTQRRRLRARARGPHAQRRRAGRLLGRPRRALPDRLDRGRDGRGGLGRLEDAHRAPRRAACSSSATTCSSPTPSACAAGIDAGVANSILIKVNQIGTLTETLAGDRDGARGRLHGRHEPPLGRDRGRHDRRPRRGHRLRADQDRRARRARTASPSTTSCCASRSSSAPTAEFPGRGAFRALLSGAATVAGRRFARRGRMPGLCLGGLPRVGRRARPARGSRRPAPRRASAARAPLAARPRGCAGTGSAGSRCWRCWSRSSTCT